MKRTLSILTVALAAISCGKTLDNSHFVPGPGEESGSGSTSVEIVPDEVGENQIKVISFNVRTSTGDANHATRNWTVRSAAVKPLLTKENPTVFGVQEAREEQVKFIKDALPEYECYGVGRDDGANGGEHMGIFWKKDVVTMGEHGTFWLSETPDTPSIGWDAGYRRTATWAVFTMNAGGQKFFYLNTHIDHKGAVAKQQSMALIVEKINELNPEGYPVIVTADFNADSSHSMFDVFTKAKLYNAREEAATTDTQKTYNAWGGTGSVIDHVYVRNFNTLRYKTIVDTYEGVRYVSDHYPIYALLEFKD